MADDQPHPDPLMTTHPSDNDNDNDDSTDDEPVMRLEEAFMRYKGAAKADDVRVGFVYDFVEVYANGKVRYGDYSMQHPDEVVSEETAHVDHIEELLVERGPATITIDLDVVQTPQPDFDPVVGLDRACRGDRQ